MSDDPIVIVGAGQCGQKAAETLRQHGYSGGIILVGDEAHPPYQRPPLSKAYLKGELEAARLFLKADDYYSGAGIDLRLSTRVASIEPDSHTVTLADGQVIRYGKLLLATGTRARSLPLPGIDHEGVHTIRSIDDVDRIAAILKPSMRVVIIGGGYIGLEVASALRMRGNVVTVVEGAERVMQRVVSPDLSAFFHKLHVDHGVDLIVGTGIEAIEGNGSVKTVLLADGSRVEADLVLVAVGAAPVTELAEDAGLAIDNGIAVDGQCRTSAPDVYAAGDCASFHSGRFGRTIRLESVQNAIDQGKHAAMAMLGEQPDYDPVPWFWSDQYDVKLQIAGLSQGYDRVEIEGNPDEKTFAVRYFRGDRLLCVDSVNMARAHMLARRELAAT